ncbi:MAG TPA: VOC family protein [Thermoplasmata archaeon]|nr:VOC family protein [Thermoplasmata archaeon]
MAPGVLDHTGIRVRDLERSRRFYVEGLGLRSVRSRRTASGGRWERLEDPETGAALELNVYPDNRTFREGDELDHLAFRVDGLSGEIERLVRLGGQLKVPETEEDGVRLAFVADPDGVWIKLFERSAPDEPPTSRPME